MGCPACLGIVDHRAGGHVCSTLGERAHTVEIPHQHTKILVLGVLARVVEVGRAIRIVFLGRKRVRDVVIHAADQEMVAEELHEGTILGPTECTEDLAHGTSLLLWLNVCRRGGKFGMHVLHLPHIHFFVENEARVVNLGQTGDHLV